MKKLLKESKLTQSMWRGRGKGWRLCKVWTFHYSDGSIERVIKDISS